MSNLIKLANRNINDNEMLHFSETVPANSTSSPLFVYGKRTGHISVGVYPSAGATGNVEFTISPPEDILANSPNVRWLPWDNGSTITDIVDAIVNPVTAIRCVATGGTVDWEVLA